jgi:hypothetical protein
MSVSAAPTDDEIHLPPRAMGRIMWTYLCAKKLNDEMGGNPH